MSYAFESIYFDDDIVPGRVLDIFQPASVTRDIALFWVHGGGWRGGTRENFHPLMEAFCQHGFVCAATDYRLSGTTILDQIHDVRCGYQIFRDTLVADGYDPGIAVYGSSAGAHLAGLLSVAAPGECGEDTTGVAPGAGWQRPVGVCLQATPVTFEPWDEIFPAIWQSMQNIAGVPYAENPGLYRRVSMMSYIDAETCPVFLLDAENEHMFPRSLCLEFVAKMRAAGRRAEHKVYPGVEHGFFYELTRREQKAAFADILAFVESLGA